MPRSLGMLVRYISPRSCSAEVFATSTTKSCAPLLMVMVSGTVRTASFAEAAASPPEQALSDSVASASAAAKFRNIMTASAFLFDHHGERPLAALDHAGQQRLVGLDLDDTGPPHGF